MFIVKIGGGKDIDIEAVSDDIASISEPVIIVHGANAFRDQLAENLNLEVETVTSLSGYSSVVTDERMIDLMLMSYAGLRNKRIVAALQARGVNAIGLSGIDGGVIRARRNRGFRAWRNNRKMMIRDLTGKPESLNTELISLLLAHGYTPVLTVPVLDEQGVPINTENDDVIALLHHSLRADRIIQLIEAPGFMADPTNAASLISNLTVEALNEWETRAEGRIKRKLHALTKIFAESRPAVHIGDGRVVQPITRLIKGEGTCIR